jgi:serine/threonine-protein kinase
MIGKTLSHYKVQETLGSGGMGVVYRATDTTLNRDVAIKVLPEAFTQNPERLARFEREARLLASLNHPNIVTIHGLEESDGVRFLVMELVEGETLAERIKRGSVPLDEALPLFMQIAEALEAAHEKGIIHRDLKPANVKVTPEGKVNVLDFDLAKAMEPEEPAADSSQSPTLTKGTALGAILGNAAYMSPEQARGKPVDKRADIWAYGCALYEALTGRVAFLGETVSDTIAATLEREPDWERLPEHTPTILRSLLRRCLRKNPDHRVHDMADARIEVGEAISKPSGIIPASAPHVSTTNRRRAAVPWMITGIGEGFSNPFFSPDGNWVGFFGTGGQGLQKVPLDGVGAVELCDGMARGASWGPNDVIIFPESLRSGLLSVSASGGNPEVLTTLDTEKGERSHWWPHILPDGKSVLFSVYSGGDPETDSEIVLQSLETGERYVLTQGGCAQYVSTGHLVFFRRDALFAAPLDLEQNRLKGAGVPFYPG